MPGMAAMVFHVLHRKPSRPCHARTSLYLAILLQVAASLIIRDAEQVKSDPNMSCGAAAKHPRGPRRPPGETRCFAALRMTRPGHFLMACYEKVVPTCHAERQRSIHVGHAARLVRPDASLRSA